MASVAPPGPARVLGARGITVRFQGVTALAEVDLVLERGEILGLIGPNGAGKSTLTNVLSGFQQPTTGGVFLDDKRITGMKPTTVVRNGVARTFQGIRTFGTLTAFENIYAAACQRDGRRLGWDHTWDLIDAFGLSDVARRPANSLALGEERLVEIARTAATRPDFLLMDEPAAGLNEAEGERLIALIRQLRDQLGCGILLIEHDIPLVTEVCERLHVLDHGQTLAAGEPREVLASPQVQEAYLGVQA